MKTFLSIAAILVFGTSVFSQGTMLTKEETINYLNKKAKETYEWTMLRTLYKGSNTYGEWKISDFSLTLKNGLIEIQYTEKQVAPCTGDMSSKILNNWLFNPAHFQIVNHNSNMYPKETSVVIAKVWSKFDSVKLDAKWFDCAGNLKNVSYNKVGRIADFPFYVKDPDNLKRIEKAFSHLRDLVKAEEDPFDN